MDHRQYFEQGRFIRSFVSEPVSTLVRPEDLAFCASRLLELQLYTRRKDPALGALLKDTLGDLAALNPDSAVQRLQGAGPTWERSPVYWALACHVLAQVLSEYSREASPTTVSLLRSSLASWFPSFRAALEQRVLAGVTDPDLICFQIMLAQCALFHDAGALEWACAALMQAFQPEHFREDVPVDTAMLLAGVLSRSEDAPARVRLAQWLEACAPTCETAREARRILEPFIPAGTVVPGSMGSARHATMTSGRLSPGAGASSSRAPQAPKVVVERTGPIRTALMYVKGISGSLGVLVLPVLLIGGIIFCIFGVGKLYDFVEGVSNVGDQSAKEWYAQAEARRQGSSDDSETPLMPHEDDGQPAVPDPVVEATPPTPAPEVVEVATPAPAPIAAPEGGIMPEGVPPPSGPAPLPNPFENPPPPVDTQTILRALEEITARHEAALRVRLGVPRTGENAGRGRWIESRTAVADRPTYSAGVMHTIEWTPEGGTPVPQFITARYIWTGYDWRLQTIVRGERQEGSNPRTFDGDEERRWLESLVIENPFY